MNRKDFLRLAGAGASLAALGCAGNAPPVVHAESAPPKPATDAERRDKLIGQLVNNSVAMFELLGVYLGERLGLFAALAGKPHQTSTELAAATKTHERYVREWLEQQTMAGTLDVQDASLDAKSRRYSLPPGHVEVLTERDSVNYLAPLSRLVVSTTAPLPQIVDAYRTGQGVPWSAYGADAREGQGAVNRAAFLQQLGKEWLPAIPDLDKRLKSSPPARVADIGCGVGWSAIGMAKAYPTIRVDGFDIDAPSIELARANARAYGVADRVTFHVKSAYDPIPGKYDLVTGFEMLHDLSRPVAALQTMRALAGDTGSVLICDERVGERFAAKADEVERMMYGWSILMCLPTGKDDSQSAETGTVMRPDTLRRYAKEAGFADVQILPIDNYFFRFYRITS